MRKSDLDLKQLISGDPARLRFVKRYAIFNCLHPESVAEHSYYTALFCLAIGSWVEDNVDLNIHLDTLLARALVHDLEESRTGDLLRMFKHRDAGVATVIEAASKAEVEILFNLLFHSTNYERPNLSDRFVKLWSEAKNDTVEGRILRFADFLSVLGYLLQELQVARKVEVAHTEDFQDYAKQFEEAEYDFIRPLVVQSRSILVEISGE